MTGRKTGLIVGAALGAALIGASGEAKALICGDYQYLWNYCVNITNDTQGTMKLKDMWRVWDNEWGLGNGFGGTTNRPPKTITRGQTITTGVNAAMGFNAHFYLEYVVEDAAGTELGMCKIQLESSYPGYKKDTKLSHYCDREPPTLGIGRWVDSQANSDFTYHSDGLKSCPSGLARTSTWTILNKSGKDLVVTKLAAWEVEAKKWDISDSPGIDDSFGTKNYQLAVSNTSVGDKDKIYVQTCASRVGADQPAGSLYLNFQLKSAETKKLGPVVFVTWSGSGKVVITSKEWTADDAKKIITVTGG